MKTAIRSTVPTGYQLQSINFFGIPVKSNGNGSCSCEQIFQTKKDAINYLIKLIDRKSESNFDSKEIREMKAEVRQHNRLSYDAATAYIEKAE